MEQYRAQNRLQFNAAINLEFHIGLVVRSCQLWYFPTWLKDPNELVSGLYDAVKLNYTYYRYACQRKT
jgi:hypothetical protein